MKKAILVLLALALALSMLVGCGGAGASSGASSTAAPSSSQATGASQPAAGTNEKDFSTLRIAHLAGRLGDEGFQDAVMRGVQKFADETGCELLVVENADVNDYAQNARNFAQEGYDLVLVTESSAGELVAEFAPEYPDTHFLINNARIEGIDNITSSYAAQEEMAFLSGAFSVLMNQELGGEAKAGMLVGVRGALDPAVYGFMAGAKYAGGEASIVYVGNFTDVAKGKEITLQMYQEGLKLVQTFAGGAGVGGFQAAESMPEGYYALGSADGQFHLSERIIASTIQDNAAAYYLLLMQFANGELAPGNTGEISVRSGASDFRVAPAYLDTVPKDIQDFLEKTKQMIISGEIDPPTTEDGFNSFSQTM